MTITRVAEGHQASIDDLNQLIDLLEGTSGFTLAFLLRCLAASDFKIRLADNAGARKFIIQDSDGVTVASIDSDGNLVAAGLSLTGAFILPQGTAPVQTAEGSVAWDTDDDVLTVGTGAATKRIGLTRGAGSNATATAEMVYDTTAAVFKVWDGSASQTVGDFVWIRKAAIETVNNSNTLQDDDDFQFTVAANTDYLVEMCPYLTSATATPDMKFAWTLVGMTWDGYVNASPGASGSTITLNNFNGIASAATTALASASVPTANAMPMVFTIHAGSTGGTLKFQWAQNTATSENTSLLKNSWLRYRRLGAT
jgi:hypothetical protein